MRRLQQPFSWYKQQLGILKNLTAPFSHKTFIDNIKRTVKLFEGFQKLSD